MPIARLGGLRDFTFKVMWRQTTLSISRFLCTAIAVAAAAVSMPLSTLKSDQWQGSGKLDMINFLCSNQ